MDAVIDLARRCLLPADAAEADSIVSVLSRTGHAVTRRVDGALVAAALVSPGRKDPTAAHLDLLLVDPAHRRQGIATEMLAEIEQWARDNAFGSVRVMGNPPDYAWPGVDVRYTAAVCALTAAGFQRTRTAWNMTAPTTWQAPAHLRQNTQNQANVIQTQDDARGDLRTWQAPAHLRQNTQNQANVIQTQDDARGDLRTWQAPAVVPDGVTVRRALKEDLESLLPVISGEWGSAWASEVERALTGDGGVHIALRDGDPIAFAAWGACRPSWFGPMGTLPSATGLGLGGVLLRLCLADQAALGLSEAQIGWVGPVRFYSNAADARIERVFFLFDKPL